MGRTYHCLLCAERPVFHGRIAANVHARECHASLLEDHHPDEFFEIREPPEDEDTSDVWFCRHPGCGGVRESEYAIRNHVSNGHSKPYAEQEAGVDYWSGDDKLTFERECVEAERRDGDAFARRIESVRGVADFLTECGS